MTINRTGPTSTADPATPRAGTPAERWHLHWATNHQTVAHPQTGQPAAPVPKQIRQIRPVGAASGHGHRDAT